MTLRLEPPPMPAPSTPQTIPDVTEDIETGKRIGEKPG